MFSVFLRKQFRQGAMNVSNINTNLEILQIYVFS